MNAHEARRRFTERRLDSLEKVTRGGVKLAYTNNPGDGRRWHVDTPTGTVVLVGLDRFEAFVDGVEAGIDAVAEARGWGE